jgi:hypothetical protein
MNTAILDQRKAQLANIQEIVTQAVKANPNQPPRILIRIILLLDVRPSVLRIRGFCRRKPSSPSRAYYDISSRSLSCYSTMQNEERIDVYKDFAIINTPAHTKRALYFLENTTILTIHPNPDDIRDIPELEKMFVVDNFEEIKQWFLQLARRH